MKITLNLKGEDGDITDHYVLKQLVVDALKEFAARRIPSNVYFEQRSTDGVCGTHEHDVYKQREIDNRVRLANKLCEDIDIK